MRPSRPKRTQSGEPTMTTKHQKRSLTLALMLQGLTDEQVRAQLAEQKVAVSPDFLAFQRRWVEADRQMVEQYVARHGTNVSQQQ